MKFLSIFQVSGIQWYSMSNGTGQYAMHEIKLGVQIGKASGRYIMAYFSGMSQV